MRKRESENEERKKRRDQFHRKHFANVFDCLFVGTFSIFTKSEKTQRLKTVPKSAWVFQHIKILTRQQLNNSLCSSWHFVLFRWCSLKTQAHFCVKKEQLPKKRLVKSGGLFHSLLFSRAYLVLQIAVSAVLPLSQSPRASCCYSCP